jgi:hypothetical protein
MIQLDNHRETLIYIRLVSFVSSDLVAFVLAGILAEFLDYIP